METFSYQKIAVFKPSLPAIEEKYTPSQTYSAYSLVKSLGRADNSEGIFHVHHTAHPTTLAIAWAISEADEEDMMTIFRVKRLGRTRPSHGHNITCLWHNWAYLKLVHSAVSSPLTTKPLTPILSFPSYLVRGREISWRKSPSKSSGNSTTCRVRVGTTLDKLFGSSADFAHFSFPWALLRYYILRELRVLFSYIYGRDFFIRPSVSYWAISVDIHFEFKFVLLHWQKNHDL